ncbi:ATP-binding protein [Spongiactinospora sp. 9N601]|uniref:ATP-binding protein n=1 Tax=Spongiactinospora sp. 9N601 TaxID=3375149 RepID=UPI0037BC5BBA
MTHTDTPPACSGRQAQRPQRWTRTFPGTKRHIAEARRFVTTCLADHPEADTAELIVSELATNAIRHTNSGQAGGRFQVTLHRTNRLLLLTVLDEGGPTTPRLTTADDLDLTGRGLHLITQLANGWGTHATPTSRTVWALLHLTTPHQ